MQRIYKFKAPIFYTTKRYYLASLLFLLFSATILSQEKYTISGSVTDATSGEELLGASIWITELGSGAITNEYGFYSITIPKGDYKLNISYVGYTTIIKEITLEEVATATTSNATNLLPSFSSKKLTAMPLLPARPVRPTRCT